MDQLQKRRVLGKAVKAALKSHGFTQEDLSRLTGFDTSKTSRLIQGKISADAETVDAILGVFSDKQTKHEIVNAYLNDVTSPETRKHFSIIPRSGVKPGHLDITHLSPAAASAASYIMEQISAKRELENFLVEFAKATGWPGLSVKKKAKPVNAEGTQKA